MIEPLTIEKIIKHPILYKEAPNIREYDVRIALDGLKQDTKGMVELPDTVMRLVLYNIDTWFPAFKKE